MENFSRQLATPVLPGYNTVATTHSASSLTNNDPNLGVEVKNKAHSFDREALGILSEAPKFPQYSTLNSRIQTFENWPSDLEQTPDILAAAGLIYTGSEDMVRCYFCGGGLKSWDPPDDPWEEHERWYPNCPHIKLNRESGRSKLPNSPNPVCNSCSFKTDSREKQADYFEDYDLQSVAAQSLLINGIEERKVKQAVKHLRRTKGHAEVKAEELAMIVFDLEDDVDCTDESETEACSPSDEVVVHSNGSLPSFPSESTVATIDGLSGTTTEATTKDLLEENRQLKENLMCKICLDNMACIIFLPCGHMVSCPQCAPAMKKCPICRQHIRGSVKAYLS